MEGAEQVVLEGLPQPHFGGDAAVEELVLDVEPVHPLRGRRQTQQLPRLEMVDDPPICGGRGVVELVDDDDVEVVGSQLLKPLDVQRLDAGEHVIPSPGLHAGVQQLAERGVVQDFPVGAQRLLEDLLAVSHEQQSRTSAVPVSGQASVVEGGHDRLPRTSCRDQKVAVPPTDFPLHGETFQHVPLVREGAYFQAGEVDLQIGAGTLAPAWARAPSSRSPCRSGS